MEDFIRPTCLCEVEMIIVEEGTWQCPNCYAEETEETLKDKTN